MLQAWHNHTPSTEWIAGDVWPDRISRVPRHARHIGYDIGRGDRAPTPHVYPTKNDAPVQIHTVLVVCATCAGPAHGWLTSPLPRLGLQAVYLVIVPVAGDEHHIMRVHSLTFLFDGLAHLLGIFWRYYTGQMHQRLARR